MKRSVIALLAGVLLFAFAATAAADIGWAGNIWPCDGQSYTTNDDIDVYVQVWKDGCTGETSGPCADIECYLYYRCSGTADPFVEVPMVLNILTGNNDEYTGTIPQGHGCSEVEFYVRVHDTTGGDDWYPDDQCDPPDDDNFYLPITAVTAQDVTVTFHLCLAGDVVSNGIVGVMGSVAPLEWGNCYPMVFSCEPESPKLYEADVLFPAGSNPYVEYKYKRTEVDPCDTWEGVGNRSFTIDDSGPTMDLWLDGWDNATPDCPDCPTAVEQSTWGVIKAIYK